MQKIIEFSHVQQLQFSQVYPQAETKPEFQQTKSLDFDSKGKNGKLKIFHFSIAVFYFYVPFFCVLIIFDMKTFLPFLLYFL